MKTVIEKTFLYRFIYYVTFLVDHRNIFYIMNTLTLLCLMQ